MMIRDRTNFLGLQDAAGLKRRLARLGICLAHFAEEMQVRGHYNSGVDMRCGRDVNFIGEVIGEKANGDLALPVRVLINRSGDDAFLKIRRHLREEVGGNELHFSFETASAESAANRKAVDGVHVKSV